ncbi:MAG: hypothetical protein WC865_17890 [Bacteroidales bacterium]
MKTITPNHIKTLTFSGCPEDGSELHTVLRKYIDYYNNRLCHPGIDHQIPAHRYDQAA